MSVLINPTSWLLCAAFAAILLARDTRQAWGAARRWATRTPVLVVLTAAVAANLGSRALLGQAVPGDFAQEVAGSYSLAAGRPLYPADVNEDVRAWLAKSPPPIPGWLPGPVREWLARRQKDGRNRLVAQAHPPTLIAAAAPLVLWLGPYDAYWIVTIGSIVAAAVAALTLMRVFAPAATNRERLLAVLMYAGWQPVLATVRDGQPSMIVAALLVVGWQELRRDRQVSGGFAIGSAAALKLYPLLLLVPLAVGRRRALVAALACLGGAAAVAAVLAGPAVWLGYAASAGVIAQSFTNAPHNLSLAARLASGVPVPVSLLWVAYPLAGAGAVALTLWTVRRTPDTMGSLRVDREFASFVTLALVLSPVAWHHYVCMLALPLAVLARLAWIRGGRAGVAGVLGLALLLSLPDTVWRVLWQILPPAAALLVSPGLGALALWAALLAGISPRRGAVAAPAAAPGRCRPAEGAP